MCCIIHSLKVFDTSKLNTNDYLSHKYSTSLVLLAILSFSSQATAKSVTNILFCASLGAIKYSTAFTEAGVC